MAVVQRASCRCALALMCLILQLSFRAPQKVTQIDSQPLEISDCVILILSLYGQRTQVCLLAVPLTSQALLAVWLECGPSHSARHILQHCSRSYINVSGCLCWNAPCGSGFVSKQLVRLEGTARPRTQHVTRPDAQHTCIYVWKA